MAATIDDYITRYRAEDQGHSSVSQKVARNLDHIGDRAQALHKSLSFFAGGVKSLFGTLATFSGGGLAAGVGLFGLLTKAALDQTATVERLTATYAALTGGMESGFAKMSFVKKFATSALGEFTDLAEGGTLMEGFGLRMERFLPLVSAISGAFGGAREQVLSLSTALGRLMSGQAGESLERLGEFGITRGDLVRTGLVTFDKGGELTSKISDLFTAIEKVGMAKFGNISRYMAGTLGQVGSNLKDTLNQALEAFGTGFAPFVKNLVAQFQPFVQFLTQSGVMSDVGKNFAASFQSILGDGGVPRFAFMMIAAFEQLPGVIKSAWDTAQKFVDALGKAFVWVYNTIGEGWANLMTQIDRGIYDLVSGFRSAVADIAGGLASVDLPGSWDDKGRAKLQETANRYSELTPPPMARLFTPIKTPGEGLGRAFEGVFGSKGANLLDKIGSRTDQLMGQFGAFQAAGGGPGLPDPKSFPMFSGQGPMEKAAEKQTELMERIEKNTRPEKVDLRNFIVGGGQRAAAGIPFIDLARERGQRGAARGPAVIRIERGRLGDQVSDAIDRYVEEKITAALRAAGVTN